MAGDAQLSETDDPRALVLGDPDVLDDTVRHLSGFAGAFDRAARGLRGIDVGVWTGSAADAFHSVFRETPTEWTSAADAFGDAATAVDRFHRTLVWAQGSAGEAAALYRRSVNASEAARQAYNQQVDSYNTTIVTPGATAPAPPPPFQDPGAAGIQRAQEILDTARHSRDAAGYAAVRAIGAAAALAPPLPSGRDQFAAGMTDRLSADLTQAGHFLAGVGEGTEDLLRFARSLNPADPYNMTHPAAYLSTLSDTAAGLVHLAAHPLEIIPAVTGTGWGSDPANAGGRLVPGLILAALTGGGGVASKVERGALDGIARPGRQYGGIRHGPDGPESFPDGGAAPIKDVPALSYSVKDLTRVSEHLSRPGMDHSPTNDAMIESISNGIGDGRPLSEAEINFMRHETTEAELMDGGMSYTEAHEVALTTHPLMKNYSPEVIDRFPDVFNNNWRRTWGMEPR